MEHTKIPTEELEVFKNLKDINVVFDVGARADIDYLEIKPEAEFHLFEPNPDFANELLKKVTSLTGKRGNVFVNPFGLGDKSELLPYSVSLQSFVGGESQATVGDGILVLHTLDWYTEKFKIKKIDFLKIDTEGFDFKVLQGGLKTIDKCRYIQYEHWDDKLEFHNLLEDKFIMCYIGYRNVLCIRKGEKWPS